MVTVIGIDILSDAQYSLTTYIDTTDTLDEQWSQQITMRSYSAKLMVTNEFHEII